MDERCGCGCGCGCRKSGCRCRKFFLFQCAYTVRRKQQYCLSQYQTGNCRHLPDRRNHYPDHGSACRHFLLPLRRQPEGSPQIPPQKERNQKERVWLSGSLFALTLLFRMRRSASHPLMPSCCFLLLPDFIYFFRRYEF